MLITILVCCGLVHYLSATGDFILSDEAYAALPPIFHIDDYDKCKEENKHFCKVAVQLKPIDCSNPSLVWQNINKTICEPRFYNHDELFHAICVENYCGDYIYGWKDNLTLLVEECYCNKFRHLGLSADIKHIDCKNYDNVYSVRLIDAIVLAFSIGYLLLVFYATCRDYGDNSNNNITQGSYRQFFSMRHNWRKLTKGNSNPEFVRLKSMQALRSYTMLFIILCHTFSSYIGGYVEDTRYFEDFALYPLKHIIRNSFVFLVQTFFLFSAWLLSYHMFQIINNVDKTEIKYMLITLINRYLRILPTVIPTVVFSGTIWIMSCFRGPIKDLYSDRDYQRCQENWWANLLFINNHYNHDEMCYFITWYLAADFQLYVISLFILYVIWKFRSKTKIIIGLSILTGILIQTFVTYIYDTDMLYRITPENAKIDNYRSFGFNATYTATFSNMATYMLGIGFGYIYYKYKDHYVFKTKNFRLLWWVMFPGLPMTVLIVCCYEYNKLVTSLLCGILKPLYALGIGIGLLGMSHNIGGKVKSMLEWNVAVFIGNFAYSTYLVHYGIVFARTALSKTTMPISDYILAFSFFQDVLISFPCGLLLHLIVEMPILQLQNAIIPQVRNIRRKINNNQVKQNCKTKEL